MSDTPPPYDPLQDMQDFLNAGMPHPDKTADDGDEEENDDEQPWD